MNKSRLLSRVGVGWVGRCRFPSALIIRLFQPSLAGDLAWAELGKSDNDVSSLLEGGGLVKRG